MSESRLLSDEVGMVMRLSTANACTYETLDEFIWGTAEHRAAHGDDADDFVWLTRERNPIGVLASEVA